MSAGTTAADTPLQSYVRNRVGLSLTGARGSWMRELIARAGSRIADDPEDAARRLDADKEAFGRLCDAVTVRESFFFRERNGLAILRRHALPAVTARDDRPLRVWSAGCAAGEEAYTLAMELTAAGLAGRYQVLGTDLSDAAVASARTAVYGPWALRGLDDASIDRYFMAVPTGHQVRDRFRSDVDFHAHNLLEPLPDSMGLFDVVMCRNVLIYLTPQARARAVETMVARLAPGGWLLLGSCDPLLDGLAQLDTVRTQQGVAYRRRAAAASPTASPPHGAAPPARETAQQARPRRAPDAAVDHHVEPGDVATLVAAGRRELELGQPREAERLARRAVALRGQEPAAHLLLVQALGQGGKLREASLAAARAATTLPLDAALHHLHAVVLLESGRLAEAASAARRAVYLDPTLTGGHLVLARCQELLGDHAAASRSRRNGQRLMSRGRTA